MCAAIRSATRGEKIGSESEKRTSAGFSQRPSCSRTARCAGRVRVVGRDRDELREGEDARPSTRAPARARCRPPRPRRSSAARPRCGRACRDRSRCRRGARQSRKRSHSSEGGRPPPMPVFMITSRRDPVGVLDGEAEADRAAPVLDDDGRVAQVELLDEPGDRGGVEVVRVVLEPERLVGAAEAEVVGRDRAGGRRRAPG